MMTTMIGYEDEANPVEVSSLTQEEQDRSDELVELGQKVHAARNQLQAWENRRAYLRQSCNHRVFTDEEGIPFDQRHCVICGASLGFV